MRPGRYLILVAAVLAVASCADAREGLVAQAASSFSQGIAAGNFAAACALLAPPTRERVERAGPCAAVLSQAHLPSGTRVLSTEVWGSQAQVRTVDDTKFLTESGGGWKIAAAGCQSRGEAPYDCALEGT